MVYSICIILVTCLFRIWCFFLTLSFWSSIPRAVYLLHSVHQEPLYEKKTRIDKRVMIPIRSFNPRTHTLKIVSTPFWLALPPSINDNQRIYAHSITSSWLCIHNSVVYAKDDSQLMRLGLNLLDLDRLYWQATRFGYGQKKSRVEMGWDSLYLARISFWS